MGFLMLAGLLGSIGYMGYFAKNESIALLADSIIKPTNSLSEDKKIIQQNAFPPEPSASPAALCRHL